MLHLILQPSLSHLLTPFFAIFTLRVSKASFFSFLLIELFSHFLSHSASSCKRKFTQAKPTRLKLPKQEDLNLIYPNSLTHSFKDELTGREVSFSEENLEIVSFILIRCMSWIAVRRTRTLKQVFFLWPWLFVSFKAFPICSAISSLQSLRRKRRA